jgi:effector-binding domain-containing protein
MAVEPTVVERKEQPYVSIRSSVPMRQLGELLPPLTSEVFAWLTTHGIAPAGPVLWKYNVIDMAGEIEVEVAVPVEKVPSGELRDKDDRIIVGVLPGGRYAFATHVGHPDSLEQATAELLDWADKEGLTFDVVQDNGVERWVARLEEYLNGPDDQPDMSKWETNLIFRLAQ